MGTQRLLLEQYIGDIFKYYNFKLYQPNRVFYNAIIHIEESKNTAHIGELFVKNK